MMAAGVSVWRGGGVSLRSGARVPLGDGGIERGVCRHGGTASRSTSGPGGQAGPL